MQVDGESMAVIHDARRQAALEGCIHLRLDCGHLLKFVQVVPEIVASRHTGQLLGGMLNAVMMARRPQRVSGGYSPCIVIGQWAFRHSRAALKVASSANAGVGDTEEGQVVMAFRLMLSSLTLPLFYRFISCLNSL
jgi:expansin (peptidoglycan-binding protein)